MLVGDEIAVELFSGKIGRVVDVMIITDVDVGEEPLAAWRHESFADQRTMAEGFSVAKKMVDDIIKNIWRELRRGHASG